MCVNKTDAENLIKKAKGSLKEGDPSFDLLSGYIDIAEKMLSDVDGKLTPQQQEVYKDLEAAVGP
jgi:hypothetical protein